MHTKILDQGQQDHPGPQGHHRPQAAHRGRERAQPVVQDHKLCSQSTTDHSFGSG